MSNAADLLARYLRQRRELGEDEIFLEHLSSGQVERLLLGTRDRAPERSPAGSRIQADTGKAVHDLSAVTAGVLAAAVPAPDIAEARPKRSAVQVTDESLAQLTTMDELRDVALGCPRCRLCETRQHVVFGEGPTTAELMVIGEAPGAEEDLRGLPFQDRAGKLLDDLLASVGFSRDSVYICSVIKCRPPGNRTPEPDEVEACAPYLQRQVELVRPGAILALGGFAAQTLLASTTPLSRLRGSEHHYLGVPLVPSYHPSALIRNHGWIRPVWEDLQRIRSILDRR